MYFSARLQLSLSACSDITLYQRKLRLETSTLFCMKLSFKQDLSLISSWEVWKQSLAQSLLGDCPCVMASVAASSAYSWSGELPGGVTALLGARQKAHFF